MAEAGHRRASQSNGWYEAAPPTWSPVALWGLSLTGAAVAAVPLWSVDFLAFQDLPGHLATVRALRDLGDPASPLYGVYFRPAWLLPNALFFYLTAWLSALMPIMMAAKVILTVYVFAFPISLVVLFRSLGRSPWLALSGLLLVYNDPFGYGFASFALGMPLLFFWLAAAHRHAVHPTTRRAWGLAVGLVVLFLCHAQIFLTAGLFGVVLLGLSWEGWATLWRRAWPYVLGSLPFVAWFLRFFVFPPAQGHAEVTFGGLQSELGFRWASPRLLLDEARTDVVMGFQDQTDDVTLLAWGLFTLLVLAGRRAPLAAESPWPGLRRYTAEALTFAAVVGFVCLPLHMHGQALISSRFLPLVALLLPAWGRMPRQPLVAASLALAVFAVSAWIHVRVAHHLRDFERQELGDFRALLALLSPQDRLAYLRPDREHRIVDRGASWYLDSYHMVINGGLNRMPFHVIYPHHTVVFPERSLPRVDERRPHKFPRSVEAYWYTHALVYSLETPKFGAGERFMELLGHTGSLWLYRYDAPPRRAPAPDSPGMPPGVGGQFPTIAVEPVTPWAPMATPQDERKGEHESRRSEPHGDDGAGSPDGLPDREAPGVGLPLPGAGESERE